MNKNNVEQAMRLIASLIENSDEFLGEQVREEFFWAWYYSCRVRGMINRVSRYTIENRNPDIGFTEEEIAEASKKIGEVFSSMLAFDDVKIAKEVGKEPLAVSPRNISDKGIVGEVVGCLMDGISKTDECDDIEFRAV